MIGWYHAQRPLASLAKGLFCWDQIRRRKHARFNIAQVNIQKLFSCCIIAFRFILWGRKLDFPTINQPIPPQFVTPCKGVYASAAYVQGHWRPAVTNVGLRPTVEHSNALNSETYICGFSGNLYGKRVPVRLMEFLRPEQKFDSIETLRRQICKDTLQAKKLAEKFLTANLYECF